MLKQNFKPLCSTSWKEWNRIVPIIDLHYPNSPSIVLLALPIKTMSSQDETCTQVPQQYLLSLSSGETEAFLDCSHSFQENSEEQLASTGMLL